MSGQHHTGVTLTVRLIRSFAHRNIKHIVLHDVDLKQTSQQFLDHILQNLSKRSDVPLPFKKFKYDTMKIQHKAHGFKTSDPVINTENDEQLLLDPIKTLTENNIEHETEISLFNLEDYRKYQLNPGDITW